MTGHLSKVQIEELIINGADVQTRNHILSCESCRSEWGRLDELVQLYKSSATFAAESITDSQPHFKFASLRSKKNNRIAILACAGLLVFAASIPVYEHHQDQQGQAAQIARDNLLLQQVDTEVSEPVPEPLNSLRHLVVAERDTSVLQTTSERKRNENN